MTNGSVEPAAQDSVSLKPFLAELERFHAFANAALFNRKLPGNVVITVATRGRRKAHGWFARSGWKPTNGKSEGKAHEILIAAEIANLAPLEILHILLHEMVHEFCHESGIHDVGKSGWHTRAFKEAAEEHGLIVEKHPRLGWAVTHLQPATATWILEEFLPDTGKFNLYRPARVDQEKAPTKLKLWVCVCAPPVRARVAIPEFNATCNECGQIFRQVQQGGCAPAPQGPT